MLDNLRDSASESPFFQEEESPPEGPSPSRRRMSSKTILGLTAFQRFVLVLIVFMMTCVVGSFLLLLTQKVIPIF